MKKTILDIIQRTPEPAPWSEGDNIPWNNPDFSERMLREHLSQTHDLASRRSELIDAHAEWVFDTILGGRPARVLDLACGPGLYTARLATLGCTCEGIDFSPASIRHARHTAEAAGLSCRYVEADLREVNDFGEGFDLAMMLYGQLNVFGRDRAKAILQKAYDALRPGGRIILEIQGSEQIKDDAAAPPLWYSTESGLFAPEPHLVLQENFWNEETRTSTIRFFVVIPRGETSEVRHFALSNEAYSLADLAELLESVGFSAFQPYPTLSGVPHTDTRNLPVMTARK